LHPAGKEVEEAQEVEKAKERRRTANLAGIVEVEIVRLSLPDSFRMTTVLVIAGRLEIGIM
jgi:hypothetical protein